MKMLLFILIVCSAFTVPIHAEIISASGELSAQAQYGRCDTEGIFYDPALGDYQFTYFLFLNSEITIAPAEQMKGVFNFDLTIDEKLLAADGSLSQKLDFALNEAYLSLGLTDFLFLSAGKIRVEWGTAFAYNPTDFINPPKNP